MRGKGDSRRHLVAGHPRPVAKSGSQGRRRAQSLKAYLSAPSGTRSSRAARRTTQHPPLLVPRQRAPIAAQRLSNLAQHLSTEAPRASRSAAGRRRRVSHLHAPNRRSPRRTPQHAAPARRSAEAAGSTRRPASTGAAAAWSPRPGHSFRTCRSPGAAPGSGAAGQRPSNWLANCARAEMEAWYTAQPVTSISSGINVGQYSQTASLQSLVGACARGPPSAPSRRAPAGTHAQPNPRRATSRRPMRTTASAPPRPRPRARPRAARWGAPSARAWRAALQGPPADSPGRRTRRRTRCPTPTARSSPGSRTGRGARSG